MTHSDFCGIAKKANPDLNCDLINKGITKYNIPPVTGAIGSLGIQNTLNGTAVGDAHIRSQAFLRAMSDPNGLYSNAWWFQDDGKLSSNEMLSIVLHTEGSRSPDVRKAIAARYLNYCGGEHENCSNGDLLDFLSYYQPVLRHSEYEKRILNSSTYVDYGDSILNQAALGLD